MSKSKKRTLVPPLKVHPAARVTVTPGPVRTNGETWVLNRPQQPPVTIVTSGTSAASMDRAVVEHEDLLKRLANR